MTMMIPAWVDGDLQPVEKLKVHQLGLRHLAVSVFVMCGDQVLLQKRADCKYHTPGLWTNTCCTHPNWDESTSDCAVRRLREELGITGLTPSYATRIEYRADVGGGLTEHELVDVFVAEASRDLTVTPNPDEVSEIRWASLAELTEETRQTPDKFTPWLRIYLEEHAARIFDVSSEGASA